VGRSSTASRARPRWRSCLESTLRPRRDRFEPPWRELHCRPPAGATVPIRQGYCAFPVPPPSQLPTQLAATHPLHPPTHTAHRHRVHTEKAPCPWGPGLSEREAARRLGDAETLKSRLYCSGS
jgi:hypothetical protein